MEASKSGFASQADPAVTANTSEKLVIAVGPIVRMPAGGARQTGPTPNASLESGGGEGQQSLTVLGTAISKHKSVKIHFCCNYKS